MILNFRPARLHCTRTAAGSHKPGCRHKNYTFSRPFPAHVHDTFLAMKVIFVNRFFHPDISATAQMLADLAFGLALRRANVLVITNRHRYDDPKVEFPARERVRGVEVLRVWTSRYGPAPLSARMVDYLSFYLFASLALAWRARRGDIVVANTDPALISVPVAVVAFLRGARLVNWIQDIYPEVAERKGVRLARGAIGTMLRTLRNCSIRSAACNVVLGERMAGEVRRISGADPDRIEVIHNWANGDAIFPVPHKENPLCETWALSGKFVVMYSGNMGQVHEFETILKAAASLLERPEIVFLFVGSGFYRGWIEHEAKTRGLANVRFAPYQPRELLAQSLGVAHVHLTSLLSSMEGLVVPSKIYGVLASGRPTLHVGDPKGEIASLLESGEAGFTVPSGDWPQLAKRLLELASDPRMSTELGKNARRTFERLFTMEAAHERWRETLLRIDRKVFG